MKVSIYMSINVNFKSFFDYCDKIIIKENSGDKDV